MHTHVSKNPCLRCHEVVEGFHTWLDLPDRMAFTTNAGESISTQGEASGNVEAGVGGLANRKCQGERERMSKIDLVVAGDSIGQISALLVEVFLPQRSDRQLDLHGATPISDIQEDCKLEN